MDNPNRCVVDAKGNYKEFVLVDEVKGDDGKITLVPQGYDLKEGERLVDVPPPSELKPKLDKNNQWVETATAEEIAAARPHQNEPDSSDNLLTRIEVLESAAMELGEMLAETQTAVMDLVEGGV